MSKSVKLASTPDQSKSLYSSAARISIDWPKTPVISAVVSPSKPVHWLCGEVDVNSCVLVHRKVVHPATFHEHVDFSTEAAHDVGRAHCHLPWRLYNPFDRQIPIMQSSSMRFLSRWGSIKSKSWSTQSAQSINHLPYNLSPLSYTSSVLRGAFVSHGPHWGLICQLSR